MSDKKKDSGSDSEQKLKIEHVDKKNAPKHYNAMTLAILNAPIATAVGNYTTFPIPVESARILANSMEITSHIGHQSTAKLVARLLGRPIEYTREELHQKTGQLALVFRLKERQPEGVVLSLDELEQIGYDFWLLYRTK
jgi:hypothetical protein